MNETSGVVTHHREDGALKLIEKILYKAYDDLHK